jgi:hypothetical protein
MCQGTTDKPRCPSDQCGNYPGCPKKAVVPTQPAPVAPPPVDEPYDLPCTD